MELSNKKDFIEPDDRESYSSDIFRHAAELLADLLTVGEMFALRNARAGIVAELTVRSVGPLPCPGEVAPHEVPREAPPVEALPVEVPREAPRSTSTGGGKMFSHIEEAIMRAVTDNWQTATQFAEKCNQTPTTWFRSILSNLVEREWLEGGRNGYRLPQSVPDGPTR
jgi:hypothetical protein